MSGDVRPVSMTITNPVYALTPAGQVPVRLVQWFTLEEAREMIAQLREAIARVEGGR